MKKNYARNDLDHLSTPEYTRSKDEKYVSCIIHFISSIYVIKNNSACNECVRNNQRDMVLDL